MDLRDKIRGCGRISASQVTRDLAARTMAMDSAGNKDLAQWMQSVGRTSDDGARLALALTYVLEAMFGEPGWIPPTEAFILTMAGLEARGTPGYTSHALGRAQDVLGRELHRAFLDFAHGTAGLDGQVGLKDADAGHAALATMFDSVWPEGECGYTLPPGRLYWLRKAREEAVSTATQKGARRPR